MNNKKIANGVQATIERLTGKNPCPSFLRNALNKYLYEPALFGGRKNAPKRLGKLNSPATDPLVLNLLSLDEVFRGETETVVEIVTGEISERKLKEKLRDAKDQIQRRLDTYKYWANHIENLSHLLTNNQIDFNASNLEQLLSTLPSEGINKAPVPYGLRAVQMLEESESKGRLASPTSQEYVARADAYLALSDYRNAARNAKYAIDIDVSNAQAWFIRVVVALRQRNLALTSMRSHQIEAQEIAEPMSSHERSALDRAAESSIDAQIHQDHLAEILPMALLYWPRLDARRFDHNDQRSVVRDLFIDHVFNKIVGDDGAGISQRSRYEMNGLREEWLYQNSDMAQFEGLTFYSQNIDLTPEESRAFQLILAEVDVERFPMFNFHGVLSFARMFKLLHLRWALKCNGYAEQFKKMRETITDYPANFLEENIYRSQKMTALWQMHICMSDGSDAVLVELESWRTKENSSAIEHQNGVLLRSYIALFHRLFVRSEFDQCSSIARLAQYLCREKRIWVGGIQHPYNEMVSIPADRTLYWKYLEALAAINVKNSGANLSDSNSEILGECEVLAEQFLNKKECFWTESELFEDGGGDDWLTEPYGLDLTVLNNWES